MRERETYLSANTSFRIIAGTIVVMGGLIIGPKIGTCISDRMYLPSSTQISPQEDNYQLNER